MSRIYFGSKNLVLNSIKEEFPLLEIVQIDNIIDQIKNINKFFDDNKIFLFLSPDNDEIKLIENQITKKIGKNFIYFESDNFDGRLSLIQAIKKSNSIFDFSLPIVGDYMSFHRHIMKQEKKYNVKIDSKCIDWLKINSPIYRLKSKTNKKEILYHDIDLLSKEIEKLSSIKNILNIEDFDNSLFKKDDDIFMLIDHILNKDIEKSIMLYEKLKSSIGEQAMLMIIVYHMIFMLNLIGGKEKFKYNTDKILEYVELRDILGRYLGEDMKNVSFSIKAQNPMRIKISLSKYNLRSEFLSKVLNIIVDTVLSLRNNAKNNTAGFLMLNRIAHV